MVVTHRGDRNPGEEPGGAAAFASGKAGPARRAAVSRMRRAAEVVAAAQWRENRERGPLGAVWRGLKRAVWQRFNRLNAPVVYPWSPSRDGVETAHLLHREAAALLRAWSGGGPGRFWLRVKAVLWLPLALAAGVAALLRFGRHVRAWTGQGLREQWRDVREAAWKHGIFPTEYYHHRVFHGEARRDKALYLNEREMVALLAAAGRGVDAGRVDDLYRFFGECRAAGLPVPRVLAAFREGRAVEADFGAPEALVRKDVYVRPNEWREGPGAQLWRWNERAGGWEHREECLLTEAFWERCRVMSQRRACVAQECLRNHPDVARFSAGGLCSVRVATGMDAGGRPVPLFAVFHLPASDVNGLPTPAGELHAGVGLADGSLLAAWGEFVSDGEFEAHPGNGAVIAGVVLPNWGRVLELALRAHRHFAEIPFVGWEIGLAASGPVLLEAATNWGVFHHALPLRTPFGELCIHHLEAARRRAGDAGP